MPFINGGEITDDSAALEVVDAAPLATESALGGFFYENPTRQLHVSYDAVDPTDTFVRGIAVSQSGRVRCLDVSVGDGADPYFASVTSLLHYNGADGSKTLTDVTGRTWNAVGDAELDTGQFKFGTASLQLSGGGASTTNTYAGVQFGTGDFTVEFWMRSTQASGSYIGLLGVNSGSGIDGNWIIDSRAAGAANCTVRWYAGGWFSLATGTDLCDGNWHHVALAREGDNLRIFLDGVLKNTATGVAAQIFGNDSAGVVVGYDAPNAGYYNGRIDDLRITKGVARYTSNFAVPTAAFPDVLGEGGGSGELPAGVVYVGGIAISSDGQLCTDSDGPATQYSHGWPTRSDGAVVVTTVVIPDLLLLENGDNLLLENGDDIII